MNFDLYLKKLNIKSKTPTLALVKELQRKHIETFSFNNIAVLLGKPISLELDEIIEKIVLKNLGGYCFEHNYLMYEVLKSLGFSVRILMAKVLNNQEKDVPRTHRITLLEFENEQYIVDVGFGSMTPTKVLKLHSHEIQDGYKVVPHGENSYQLELEKEDDFFLLYRFDLAVYSKADCTMGNFYSSQHPNAVFVNNFVISLRLENITLSFRNGVYHRIAKNETEIIEIKSVEALKQMLNDDFGVFLALEEYDCLFEFNKRNKNANKF